MDFFLLPLMVLWLLISVWIGRLARKHIWHRRAAFWVVVILVNLLPWADMIAKATVAHGTLFWLGVFTPEQPIEVRGFLNNFARDDPTPSLGYYLKTRGFEYVEIQYTTPISRTPAEREGPGYYQFRLSGLDPADCTANSSEYLPNNVWHYRGHGPCYEFQRTDEPVSRYSYSSTTETLWLNVKSYCRRLTDLSDGHHIAQYCTAGYSTWMTSAGSESFPIGVPRRLNVLKSLQPAQPHATEQNIQPE